jgi:hypothetical protein
LLIFRPSSPSRSGARLSSASGCGRIAAELRNADQTEERKDELVQLRHLAVREDDRSIRVDAYGEVVGHEPIDVLHEPSRRVTVRDRLVVGDQDEQLDPEVLQTNAVLERAEVVADVQRAGRPVAGEDPKRRRVAADALLERWLPAAPGRRVVSCRRVEHGSAPPW